jgi:transcriptional regulator with XRE-family HTH domain
VSDMDDIRMEPSIGERIKRLRHDVAMTQDDLATAAGVSTDLIRKLEQGRRHTASLVSLYRIARALGVEVGVRGSRSRPAPLTWEIGGPGWWGMIVRRVVASALPCLPPAAEPAGVARPLVGV